MAKARLITNFVAVYVNQKPHHLNLMRAEDDEKNCNLFLSALNKKSAISTSKEQQHNFISVVNQYNIIVHNDQVIGEYQWIKRDLERSDEKWIPENTQLVMELFEYLSVVLNRHQILLVKHLFRSKIKKSKHLLAIIITLMLRHHNMSFLLDNWIGQICVTMPYWKKEHFVFALDNDIAAAFMCSYLRTTERNEKSSMKLQHCVRIIFHSYMKKLHLSDIYLEKLHAAALHYHKNNERIYRMQWAYCHNVQRSLKSVETTLSDAFTKTYHSKMDTLRCALRCAWIKCGKIRSKSQKLYICKGCKLLAYCSRSHQKKHWNCCHTLQCTAKIQIKTGLYNCST